MSDRKRLLNDLRVIDLRAELEKRNLDKTGVRGVLINRLSKEEGHDPATFRFDVNGGNAESKSTPTKRTRRSESTVEAESDDTPLMEDMIVQDDVADEEALPGDQGEHEHEQMLESTTADATQETTMQVDEAEKASRKRENQEDTEASEAKKPCLDTEEDQRNENNTDGEDSINLDIGDDELLNEETDNTTKTKKEDKDNTEKEKRDEGKEGGARNLWVSGLSGDTRAKDLKQLCTKHGKVIGAKVVTNARTPGSRCYGYVTMASAQDAENCIKNLHRTELHGRMISVEKAKSESDSSSRRQSSRSDRRSSKERRTDGKENDEEKDGEAGKDKKDGESGSESRRSTSRTRDKSHRSDKDKARRSTRSRERRKSPREKERDVARARERSRVAREDERRRRVAEEALRERERRQRQEKHRLALEREKLRAERAKIEREKNELLRLERERHRVEREKLELERLELKRAQLRLEEERRKRGYESSAPYRKPAVSPPPPPEPAYERDRHKRAPHPPMTSRSGQFEAPPPPRFEMTSNYDRTDKRDRDYKRDYPPRHISGNMKYPSNGSSNDDARQPMPPGTRPKEPTRAYESRGDSRAYRPSPPTKPEARSWNASSRYPDAAPASKGTSGGGGSDTWSSNEPRYGSGGGAAYETRYPPAYQPPPPGATYPDRYAQPARDYRKY